MSAKKSWVLDFSMPGSGITLGMIEGEWPALVPLFLVTFLMTVRDRRQFVRVRLDLDKRAFIDPVCYDPGDVDAAATAKLLPWGEYVAEITAKLIASEQQAN